MSDTPSGTRPHLLSHVSVGVSDLGRATRFYDAVMATLGARRVMEHGEGVAYGHDYPTFWARKPHDGREPRAGNGVHVCFNAGSPDAVVAFHRAGLDHGGFDDGAPGRRNHYAPGYYGAFLRDPDGNKVEAMCWIAPDSAISSAPPGPRTGS
jgi:catechol 2,3-dioxygenase-like lactoylglutathione lyase family enzyme